MTGMRISNEKSVGTSVLPDEARPLLDGEARFLNDISFPGMYHVAFLRSQYAHARLRNVDVGKARELPGVIKVLTGADLFGKVDPFRSMPNRFSGGESVQHWLAVEKVRFCGEAICAVVAEDRATAEDAIELIEVDYDPLPVITDAREGEKDGSPLVHDTCPNNYLIRRDYKRGPVDEAFETAHLTVKRSFSIGRKQALCLEGRGCVAAFRKDGFELSVWMSHQLPYVVRHYLAKHLGMAETEIRVVAPQTGGGFGQKASIYPEEFVCTYLARMLRRPVKWVEDRFENMVASTHAREQDIEVELALDKDGRILALRSDVWVDVGAYSTYLWSAGMEPLQTGGLMPGPYKVPAFQYSTRGVATNKTPVGPYRAVGRPSASASLELLLNEAARKLGMDAAEIRMRNMIRQEDMPYRNANNLVHDNVGYMPCLQMALSKASYDALRAEQGKPSPNGKLRGIGVACFAELTGLGTSTAVGPGTLLQPGRDAVTLRLETSGVLTIAAALPSQGQRIATAMRQVAADETGIALEDISCLTNDTGMAPYGFGTFASRTAVFGSGAVIQAATELRRRILALAAFLLDEPEDRLAIVNSVVQTVDRSKTLTLRDMAEHSFFSAKDIPMELNQGFEVTAFYDPKHGSFAAGAHVVVVDVDPDTGAVEIVRYVAAEDVGRLINPAVVEGQIIGGIAQGVGEALLEELIYDEQGQPRTVTLADYLVPSALEVPRIELHHANTPSGALGGFKGCGEGSIIGALGGIACAVSDALAQRGGDIHEFPATPERVLRGLGVDFGDD
ncbi:MAG: xanthine dehydrogenase family protein molybdopterin-binding subunit [Rhodobiaceae bacterium]|nr:xanthine dehydrogenase family protein molybdopterin-binding subunit [Rhodobiaceae bacterium]MCC0014560.1 xanthine dehydrogenase family protein molybdopterin-binding subunit [Rhodobiaceae bacterium]MCC0061359.1 xanthine dehydrogenase family protein molybdopterin-binding subunit [Rhodobiaceae bacterium]